MNGILTALPQWLLIVVAIVFLGIILERIYISKKPLVIAGKAFGPPSPNSDVEEVGKSNRPNDYLPFILSKQFSEDFVSHIRTHAAKWEKILQGMTANEFFALHSLYNEIERHDLALLCLDVAIARGMATSKNYSFRSASLRKLGRLKEAECSAHFALELSSQNVDAHYNLAKTYKAIGNPERAQKHIEAVLKSGSSVHEIRLAKAFPELTDKAGLSG